MSAANSDADDEHEENVLAEQIRQKTASRNACWNCHESNTKYMISCDLCARFYHHTCANVDKKYCKEGKYECSFCLENRNNDAEIADEAQRGAERRKKRGEDDVPEVDGNDSDDVVPGETGVPDEVTPEQLLEELLKARKNVQDAERRRLKEQDQMMARIRQLEREHTDATRRNVESNERYQKQLLEMQRSRSRSKTPLRLKTRHSQAVEVDSSSDDDFDNRKIASLFEAKMEKMRKEFESMVNVKKSKNASSRSFGTAKEKNKTPPEVSSNRANAKNYYSAPKNSNAYYERSSSSEMEIAEPSAFDKLAMTLNRSNIQQLPEFNGDPKLWPLFESVFKSTTKEGNFSGKENVSRLAKALKSPATDLVMDLLMYSADANGIMEELRSHYGKPEKIIVGLMDELMAMKSPRDQPEHKLVDFANKVKYFVTSVKAVRMYSELENEYALSKLAGKLHPSAFREWTKIRLKNPTANIERFAKFLTERVKLIPPAPSRYEENVSEARPRTSRQHGRVMTHRDDFFTARANGRCLRCKGDHGTPRCYKLENDSISERVDFAYDNKVCLSCLSSSNHIMRYCPDKKRCGMQGCTRFHHPMLHDGKDAKLNAHQMTPQITKSNQRPTLEPGRTVSDVDSKSQDDTPHERVYNNAHRDWTSKVLYQIAPITLYGNNNSVVETYVILDGASSVTLMEESIFDSLKLSGERRELTLQWTNDVTRTEDSYLTSVLVTGGKRRNVHKLSNVSTVKNLALPLQTVNTKELYAKYKHLRGIPLDDMNNIRPKVLIGLQHAKFLVAKRTRCGNDEDPVAIKTELGWIVFGRSAPSINVVSLHCSDFPINRNFQFHATEPNKYDERHQLYKHDSTTESFGVTDVKGEIMTEEEKRPSWWGSAWERLIHSIKKCVDFMFVDHNPSEEILPDAITAAEDRMNEDEKAITPNKALFGDGDAHALANAPGIFNKNNTFSKRAFRKSQHLAEMFSRWIQKYLPIITIQTKWFEDAKPIKVGDIAIRIDPALPRDAWKKGRITRVYPGKDGRAADIKLSDGTTKTSQSTGRLAVLDFRESSIERSKLKDGVEDVVEP